MLNSDAAQADSADEPVLAGLDHRGELTVEQLAVDSGRRIGVRLRVEHPKIGRGQLVDSERSQVLFQARAQLLWLLGGYPPPGVVSRAADLGDQRHVGRIRVQGLADEFVGDGGPVELRGVDVVDAQFDCPAQHCERLVPVPRRSEDTGAGQLHGAETDASDVE